MPSTALLFFQTNLRAENSNDTSQALVMVCDTLLTQMRNDEDSLPSPSCLSLSCFMSTRAPIDEENELFVYQKKLDYHNKGMYDQWMVDLEISKRFRTNARENKIKIKCFRSGEVFFYVGVLGSASIENQLCEKMSTEIPEEQVSAPDGFDGVAFVTATIKDLIIKENNRIIDLFHRRDRSNVPGIRALLELHPTGAAIVIMLNNANSQFKIFDVSHKEVKEPNLNFLARGFCSDVAEFSLEQIVEPPNTYTRAGIEDRLSKIMRRLSNLPSNSRKIHITSGYAGFIITPGMVQETRPVPQFLQRFADAQEQQSGPDIAIASMQIELDRFHPHSIGDNLAASILQALV